MSTMKKIGALIMALAMCFALAMPAFASESTAPTTGTITVDHPKAGETVDYIAYKVFSANPSGSGNDDTKPTAIANGKVAYYATAEQKTWWTAQDGNPFNFGDTSDNNVFVVTLKDDFNADKVGKFFNDHQGDMITAGVVEKKATDTAADGTVQFSDLEFGYYFVTTGNGSVVSLDTTNYNVVVEDKNTGGDPFQPGDNPDGELKDVYSVTHNGTETVLYNADTETMGTADVYIGDVVTYRVSVKTSNYVTDANNVSKKVSTVYLDDKIGSGLTLSQVAEDMTVQVVDDVNGTEQTHDLTSSALNSAVGGTNYYVEFNDDGDCFTVVVPWVDADGNPAFRDGARVNVTYKATVNADINVVDGTAVDDTAKNAAVVSYDTASNNDPDPDPKNPDPTGGKTGDSSETQSVTGSTSVYTYALAFQKLDGNDAAPLAGAHFTVKDTDGKELFGKMADDGTYKVDATVSSAANDYTNDFVTDDKGQIVVYGVNAGTFTATETTAPDGYNLLSGDITLNAITVDETATSKTITTTTTYTFEQDNENGTYKKVGDHAYELIAEGDTVTEKYKLTGTSTTTVDQGGDTVQYTFPVAGRSTEVPNYSGTELPSTGGIGTTIFYVVGGAMVIGAGVLLITKKRMAE